MEATIIKLILFTGFTCLTSYWLITSPYTIRMWLNNLFSLRGAVIAFIETIIALQLLNLINLPLPITAWDKLFTNPPKS